MKRRYPPIIYLLLLLLICASCRKDSPTGVPANDPVPGSFGEIFEDFWNQVNTNYVYWDTDTTDWDGIYYKFRPLFSQLNIHDSGDIIRSVKYFNQMTASLLDGHFQIIFNSPALSGINIYPAAANKQRSTGFHFPFAYENTDKQYFDDGYLSVYDSSTQTSSGPLHATLAIINKKALYFSCNGFSLFRSYASAPNNSIHSLLDSFFKKIKEPSSGLSGVIVDLRNNYGGDLNDLGFLVGHLIEKPLYIGFSCYKSGPGRLDFTPWITATVTPQPEASALKLPITVLVDNFTVSTAEAITMAIHALPNSAVIGENTWGATGAVVAKEVYNDGPFDIPGFMTVYQSSLKFKSPDNKSYEGVGISPDIIIPFNPVPLNNGIDPALERAILQF
jgi:carboxyl-terminal processing protease